MGDQLKRLPAELTLAEAAMVLGVNRSTAHRKFQHSLRWGMHSKRRVRVVPTRLVIQAIAAERNESPAIPEIEHQTQRINAVLEVQERQAIWAAKVARKLGIPV